MKLKKHVIKLVLCSFVVLLCMTTKVSAGTKTVAVINGKKFNSMQSAVDAVKNGQTIKLKADVKLKKDLLIKKKGVTFTLDLNKKNLKTGLNKVQVNAGKVIMKNGTVSGSVEYLNIGKAGKVEIKSGTYKGYLINKGTILLKNGNFVNKDEEFPQLINDNGKMTIYNGQYKSYGNVVKNTGTLEIKNGNFTNENEYMIPVIYNAVDEIYKKKGKKWVLKGQNKGSVVIQGGTFKNESQLIVNNSKMTIHHGEFSSKTVISNCVYLGLEKFSILKIKGGNFTGQIRENHGSVEIAGGIFYENKDNPGVFIHHFPEAKLTIRDGMFYGSICLPKNYSIKFPESEYPNHFFASVSKYDSSNLFEINE